VTLAGPRFEQLASHHDQRVSIGIRPECISVASSANNGQAISLNAHVEVVEMLGHAMDLFVTAEGGQRFVCRLPTDHIQVGSEIRLSIQPQDIHVFADADDGCGANLVHVDAD
jgi:ABC-type sugar transport system ATPase subunit